MTQRLAVTLFVAFCTLAMPLLTHAGEPDVRQLLDGVKEIAAPGAPGAVCVFGPQAFPVVAGGAGRGMQQAVVGAARLGKGRIVAFGHDGYFGAQALAQADTGRLMANAVRWAAGGEAKPRVAVHRQGGLLAFLRSKGIQAEPLDGADWAAKLTGFNVFCAHAAMLGDAAALERFIRNGGGLVGADTGWGWLQIHRGKTLVADHAGNRAIAPAGLVWADGMVGRTSGSGFDVAKRPGRFVHAGHALDALEAQTAGKATLKPAEVAQAAWTLSHAARSLPAADALLLPRLARLRAEGGAAAVPTPKKPLTMKQPLARVLLTLQLQKLRKLPPEKVQAHPAAEAFPGAVPKDAERVTRKVAIDTRVPAWHSTGLYAPPGELIHVDAPAQAVGKKLVVRIGAHSDGIWHHATWRRCPEICTRHTLAKPATAAANAFGGPLYIEVPNGCKLGTLELTVRGAVEAPLYQLGKTDLKVWRDAIRHRPGPWAELAGRRVVLTVPSSSVRKLDDPEELMTFWDRVLDACAELAARPLERERPERYVTDTQISAGYMHSGYPIMTLLDMPDVVTNKGRLTSNGHGGVWGLYHEMGHNHQSGDWTFGGTVEVTVNLFTLYVFEKVCGSPKGSFDRIGGERRAKMLERYFADGGPDFEKKWKRSPFLALVMYVQLQEAFGWDAYKKVFAEYRRLPGGERPKNDAAKRDQWMVRFSRAVGRNLGPFFEAWGVPTSKAARDSIASLPAWMPEGFPPK